MKGDALHERLLNLVASWEHPMAGARQRANTNEDFELIRETESIRGACASALRALVAEAFEDGLFTDIKGQRHLMDRWPYDPLPSPVSYENGRVPCNAEYRVEGVLVGHCSRIVRRGKTHRGKHRIDWPHEPETEESDE